MIINRANLDTLRVGFKTSFQNGLKMASSQHAMIATTVPSSAGSEKYGWLGKIPNVREWIGPRAVQGLSEHDYTINNKDWELTIGVDRNNIEDDTIGIYTPLFEEMGMSTGSHADQLVFGQLPLGFSSNGYDGQFFFDTDHPVLDENGDETSVANTDGGSGTPWYLLSTKRALKPIIYQLRKPWMFTPKDDPRDDNVFSNREFLYGSDNRANVGYGFWQMAWGSKQTLNAANYAIGRAAMMGFKGDYGRPLGIVPDLLVVPPSLESAGRKILNSEHASGGETNEWKDTAELMVCPWLA